MEGMVIMKSLSISAMVMNRDEVEVAERKGIGHPDTICDALAETLSRNLCREYRKRFGTILHHNVDKALLSGGRAAPALGGGSVLAPMTIYLAGRATDQLGSDAIPVQELAIEGSRSWLRDNLHAIDVDRHVRLHSVIHPGSIDLRGLYARGFENTVPPANDTSFGVGYAPMSALERLVLAVERRLNGRQRALERAAWGEDIKVMGIRRGNDINLTIACAMIGRYLAHVDDYLEEIAAIETIARDLAQQHGFARSEIGVNCADDRSNGILYLTATGTSAEAGDDGEVGRGNRINGLITPCRPMSLEAVAGKNPVTHVGKLYNVTAHNLAQALVEAVPEISAAQCLLVSRIGAPVTSPALLQVKLATNDAIEVHNFRQQVEEIAAVQLARIPKLIDDFVAGTVSVF
jgi:S-adenosylmethionine synthetase